MRNDGRRRPALVEHRRIRERATAFNANAEKPAGPLAASAMVPGSASLFTAHIPPARVPRYPVPMLTPAAVLPIALPWLDAAGLAVFAASGALAAARRGQTIVTLCFFALVTGVGGGTVRDLLIGAPVFWVRDAWPAALCLGVALAIWVTPERWWSGRALDWFDAVGLAAYAVFGAAKSLSLGVPPVPAALMGVVTACVGGIVRDVLAGEPSILLRREIYVTAAALAAATFMALVLLGLPPLWAGVAGAGAGFALPAGALARGWALPNFRSRA